MKKLSHLIEFILIKTALIIFRALSFERASNIGGALGRFIGKKLKVTNTARRNLKLAMPELSPERIEEIITGMWDNLGRVALEFSQINKTDCLTPFDQLVKIEGKENFSLLSADAPIFIMSGHIANWEVMTRVFASQGHKLHIVYRKANNPYIDRLICKIREKNILSASPKSSVGARRLLGLLKNNGKILMLVDQKQNDGISVKFFNIPAMTAPGIATMSLKYNAKIVPVRIIRTGGHRFILQLQPPIKITSTGDVKEDTKLIMTEVNKTLEGWIREYPEQWFWVHNRWPKQVTVDR